MQNSVIILMYNSRVSLRTNKDLNNNIMTKKKELILKLIY